MFVHVFGDTGGHASQLLRSLEKIGVDLSSFKIPEDVKIIHNGDLIHKGPDSDLIVSFVHALMVNNPGQWIQILGNHEFQHIGGPAFWRCGCTQEMVDMLNFWYQEGYAKVAHGEKGLRVEKLDSSSRKTWEPDGTSWLFTHAGLTCKLWEFSYKKEADPVVLAELINNSTVKKITKPGMMLFGGVPQFSAGPVWALSTEEVFASWATTDTVPPFNQVYGHTAPFDWSSKSWWSWQLPVVHQFRKQTKLSPAHRTAITRLVSEKTDDIAYMLGVDPSFSGTADIKEQPYVTFNSTGWV